MENPTLLLLLGISATLISFVLGLISLLNNQGKKGGVTFGLLSLSMCLWQSGKLVYNYFGYHGQEVDEIWYHLSFTGASFVYSLFYFLAIQITFLNKGFLKFIGFLGIFSSIIFILMDINGVLSEGYKWTKYGFFHAPTDYYYFYMFVYGVYMAFGLTVLFPKYYEKSIALYRQAQFIFLAALSGFLTGTIAFYNIVIGPFFPISDAAPIIYCGVLYWAIFRFNLLGQGDILKALLKKFLILVLVFVIALLFTYGAKSFGHKVSFWVFVFFTTLFFITCLLLWTYLQKLYIAKLSPVTKDYQKIFLLISESLSKKNNPLNMIESVLETIKNHYQYDDAYTVVRQNNAQWDGSLYHTFGTGVPLGIDNRKDVLKRKITGALFKKKILMQLRHDAFGDQEKYKALGDYKFLRRMDADLLIPVHLEGELLGIMVFKDKGYRIEHFADLEQQLSVIVQLLENHIFQLRLLTDNVEKEHLSHIGTMTAALAHEIKNPLEGIYGAAQILEEEGAGNKKFIDIILQDSQKLDGIVRDFLQFSRPYSAAVSEVNVFPLLEKFVSNQNTDSIKIQLNLLSGVGKVLGDLHAIEQILLNLFQNAARYNPEGQPVVINVYEDKGLHISVEDKGPGVPEGQKNKLFTPFFTTYIKGTGLGLAISKKIAISMHGDIYYRDNNPGAKFVLLLKSV